MALGCTDTHRSDGTARTIKGLTGTMRYILHMMARGESYGTPSKSTWNGLVRRGVVAFDPSTGRYALTNLGAEIERSLPDETDVEMAH